MGYFSSMRMLADPSRAKAIPLSAALALLAVAACSSSSSGSGGGGADSGPGYGGTDDASSGSGDAGDARSEATVSACTNATTPVDTYMPNMAKDGKNKLFTFLLASASPAPPAVGMNTWMVRVLDYQSGQPVPGETMSLPTGMQLFNYPHNPYMPTTGMGTSKAPTVHDNGDGTSTIVLDLTPHGVWWVFVQAQDGSTVDGTTFSFCLP